MKALMAPKRKILALMGMGLALVSLVACGSPAASSPNANAANNNVNNSNLPVATERSGGGPTSGLAVTAATHNGQITGIIVNGQGRATGTPDMATINLGVEASRDTVQAARDDAAAAMGQVIEVLQQQGIADEDIQTSHFRIDTRYDREGQKVTGFLVSNQLTVKVRDLEQVGGIIDEVVAAGGDLTRFRGISFSIDNTKPLEEQARAAAVDDLEAKAQQLASLTGVQVGELVSITETGGARPLDVRFEERAAAFDMAAAAPTHIMAGETEVVITLQAVYAIGTPPAESAQ